MKCSISTIHARITVMRSTSVAQALRRLLNVRGLMSASSGGRSGITGFGRDELMLAETLGGLDT
jgi:hypothetical protein